jgi:hypothetical protein
MDLRMKLLLLLLSVTLTATAFAQRYPAHPNVIDVQQPPYSAKGDGITDDTEAIQRAINENVGRHRLLYFPNGIYIVSKTITWPNRWNGKNNWGKTYLRGESRDATIIRLKDNIFTDEKKPEAMMWCGGFGSADWFHNYVENLTFDVGRGNLGAVALQFYSNNSGAVRDCRFIAAEDSGVTGLDLGHRDMNGPLLVRNCEIIGFQNGISCARAVNGQTFEQITMRGQRRVGFKNEGQSISIRGLVSESTVPAVMTYGTLALIEASLVGSGAAAKAPAIVNFNGGRIYLRDVDTSGYKRAVADLQTPDAAKAWRIEGEDKPGSLGPRIAEYCSQPATSPFPSPSASLRLPVKETPSTPWDDPLTWAVVDQFGADPTGKEDSGPAIQRAMDSGATTVFLPGTYRIGKAVVVRGKVRRVLGVGGMISYGKKKELGRDFRIEDGVAPMLTFEHFAYVHGGVEIATKRTVVFRSVADCDLTMTPAAEGGEIFAEDFVTHHLALKKQRMWARQLNVENQGTHVSNDGGQLWVLGYKTERGGTLLETTNGGRSEIVGGFSYTTTAGKLAPMFINRASSVWAFFGEVCYNRDPFEVLIQEMRGEETKTIGRGQGHTSPYAGYRAEND